MSAALRICLAVAAVAATVLFAPVEAQPPGAGKPATAARVAKPTWNELSPAQKEALAPLAKDWDSFEPERKLKWIEVAKKYPSLSPDGKQRLHERMAEFVKLSPEQRRNVRENFRKAYELPIDQRQALIQEYKDLPPERKRELSNKAKAGGEPAARAARDTRHARDAKKAETK